MLSTIGLSLGMTVAPTSKGMTHVALVELGSGCCHGGNVTKAAIRACNNAIEWNSVKVRTIIPGSYDAMRLHVHLAVPAPEELDLDAVSDCFPYGNLLPATKLRDAPLSSMTTVRITPPEDPSRAMACAKAFRTNSRHWSLFIPSR